jgi:hypothetical protein
VSEEPNWATHSLETIDFRRWWQTATGTPLPPPLSRSSEH